MGRRQKLMSPDSKLWSLNPSNKLISLVLRVNDPNIITSSSGPNKNETHPSPQKTGIIIIAHNISHCGAYSGVLMSTDPADTPDLFLPSLVTKLLQISLTHDWNLGREVESREIKHCLPDTRPEVPPGQCNARCCTQDQTETMQTFLHPEPRD